MRKRFLKIVHKQPRIFVARSLHLTRGGTHVIIMHLSLIGLTQQSHSHVVLFYQTLSHENSAHRHLRLFTRGIAAREHFSLQLSVAHSAIDHPPLGHLLFLTWGVVTSALWLSFCCFFVCLFMLILSIAFFQCTGFLCVGFRIPGSQVQ
jgi:hypothetical protein